jgi:hypothetical protein
MGSACDHPLHGFTVVVDTDGPRVYIGRYHSEDESGVLLLDADVRDPGEGEAKTAYLARSAAMGVFKNTAQVRIPRPEIASIAKLADYAADPAS